uniref:Uncharacterized protein n=1 Tax=Hucho hucho TaxID=62062 RepID=A0A4W5JMS0_9TELE
SCSKPHVWKGGDPEQPDLIATYRNHITNDVNQSNLAQFFKSYQSRRDLEIERPVPGGNINVRTLKYVTRTDSSSGP